MTGTTLVIRKQYQPATRETPSLVQILRFDGNECIGCDLDVTDEQSLSAEVDAREAGCTATATWSFIGSDAVHVATWTC